MRWPGLCWHHLCVCRVPTWRHKRNVLHTIPSHTDNYVTFGPLLALWVEGPMGLWHHCFVCYVLCSVWAHISGTDEDLFLSFGYYAYTIIFDWIVLKAHKLVKYYSKLLWILSQMFVDITNDVRYIGSTKHISLNISKGTSGPPKIYSFTFCLCLHWQCRENTCVIVFWNCLTWLQLWRLGGLPWPMANWWLCVGGSHPTTGRPGGLPGQHT